MGVHNAGSTAETPRPQRINILNLNSLRALRLGGENRLWLLPVGGGFSLFDR